MQLRNSERRFGALAQLFHWVTVALVVAIIVIGAYMTDLELSPEKLRVYNLHKSLGVTVLALTLLRLIWRWLSPPPPLPQSLAGWERRAARASHLGLYLLLLVQPSIGIVHAWAANFPVVLYGTVALPSLTGPDPALKDRLEALHHFLGWALCGLFLLHAAAALRHHVLLKDDVLRRMLPWSRAADEAKASERRRA